MLRAIRIKDRDGNEISMKSVVVFLSLKATALLNLHAIVYSIVIR